MGMTETIFQSSHGIALYCLGTVSWELLGFPVVELIGNDGKLFEYSENYGLVLFGNDGKNRIVRIFRI